MTRTETCGFFALIAVAAACGCASPGTPDPAPWRDAGSDMGGAGPPEAGSPADGPSVPDATMTLEDAGPLDGGDLVDAGGGRPDSGTTPGPDAGPPPCPGPIPGLSRVGPTTWEALFGAPFPQPRGSNRTLEIPRGGYVALAFDSRSPSAVSPPVTGAIDLTTVEFITSGAVLLSISRCEGEFGADFGNAGSTLPARCRGGPSGVASLRAQYAELGADNCTLEPDTTYYLNVTYGTADGPGSGQPYCSGSATACSLRLATNW